MAILLATALLVYTYRNEVQDGPDASNQFGLLLLGSVHVAMMLTIAVTMVRRSRQIAVDGPAAAAEQRFRRGNALVPVLVGYLGAMGMSAMTVASIPAFDSTLSDATWYLRVLFAPAAMAQDRGLAIEYTVKVADIPGQLFHVTTEIRNINQPALEDLIRVINRISRKSYDSFFSRYVSGTDVPPYDTFLGYAGYQLERATRKVPFLGVNLNNLGRGDWFPVRLRCRDVPFAAGRLHRERRRPDSGRSAGGNHLPSPQ